MICLKCKRPIWSRSAFYLPDGTQPAYHRSCGLEKLAEAERAGYVARDEPILVWQVEPD